MSNCDQATPIADPATIPRCPVCGGTDLTFDWDAVVTVRVTDGQVQHAVVGGVFAVRPDMYMRPDRYMCAACGNDPADCDAPTGETAAQFIGHALPDAPRRALTEGLTVYATEPFRDTDTLTVEIGG